MPRRKTLGVVLGTLALFAVPAVAPGSAAASGTTLTGTTLSYSAEGGDLDYVRVRVGTATDLDTNGNSVEGWYKVLAGHFQNAGPGCVYGMGSTSTVYCPPNPLKKIKVKTGDRDDYVSIGDSLGTVPTVINTGSGDDSVSGGLGNDNINTSTGNDGNDLDWIAGVETVDGRAGKDKVNLGPAVNPESDTESSPFDHQIGHGGDDNDTLIASGQGDELYGEDGNDSLKGSKNRQLEYGGPGDDKLTGGPGFDYLDGGDGYDYMNGGSDNDTINAVDPGGAFTDRSINCASGTDTLTKDPDPFDPNPIGCEL